MILRLSSSQLLLLLLAGIGFLLFSSSLVSCSSTVSNIPEESSVSHTDKNENDDQSCINNAANKDSSATTCNNNNNQPSTPLKLPKDFVDPCQDSNKNCRKWSQQGECNINVHYMIDQCPRSCGVCHPMKKLIDTETGGSSKRSGDDDYNPYCIDEFEECPRWANQTECYLNSLFMRESCKKSCGKCVNVHEERASGVLDEATISQKVVYANNLNGWNVRDEISQYIDRSQSENQVAVLEVLKGMDQYAKYTMTEPTVSTKTRERCTNYHRMCATSASRGLCHPLGDQEGSSSSSNSELVGKQSVLFMMNMCPLSCQMCHEVTTFHQCAGKRHPWEVPSFTVVEEDAGGNTINAFFEQKRHGSEWNEYQPTFVSYPNNTIVDEGGGHSSSAGDDDDPYVVLLQNFLSSDEADTLKSLPRSGWNLKLDADTHRTLAKCPINKPCSQNETYVKIMERISSLIDVKVSHLEPIELIQFVPGAGEFNTRLEHNFEVNSLWKPAGPRLLSLFIFLSGVKDDDNDEGGGLGFPYLDWLSIKPKKGMAVLWPNVVNDDLWTMDPRMKFEYFDGGGREMHFGAMSHVRLYNYTDAHLRGCA